MRRFWWFVVAAVAAALVAVPVLRYVAIAVLATVFVVALCTVCSGLSCERERRAQAREVQRRARAIAWDRLKVRREARWQADVEAAKRHIESER